MAAGDIDDRPGVSCLSHSDPSRRTRDRSGRDDGGWPPSRQRLHAPVGISRDAYTPAMPHMIQLPCLTVSAVPSPAGREARERRSETLSILATPGISGRSAISTKRDGTLSVASRDLQNSQLQDLEFLRSGDRHERDRHLAHQIV